MSDLDQRLEDREVENDHLRATSRGLETARADVADRYDFAPLALLTLDALTRVVDANLTAATMFGRERGKLVGAFLTGLVLPEQRAALRRHVLRCLAERARVEAELAFAVPGAAPLHAQITSMPLYNDSGEVIGTRTMVADISLLKASQEKLWFLTRASGCLVSSFDTTASLAEIARLAVPAVADACLVDLVTERGTLERVECALGGESGQATFERLRAAPPRADEGSALQRVLRARTPLLFGASPGRGPPAGDPGGLHDPLVTRLHASSILYVPIVARRDVVGVLTFVSGASGRSFTDTDVAALGDLGARAAMAIENARLYAEAQRAVVARQDVLSFVSHDLKNPLMGIMLSVETMLRAAPPEDRRRSAGQLQRIARASQQMRRMIEDLLDMTTLESGRLRVELGVHDLDRLLDEVAEIFAPRAAALAIRLELSRPPALAVTCDRSRLQQVLSNLMDNALKFTPRGGRICLSARQTDGTALCTVADTGSGIPPLVRPHVFERFVQAEGNGRQGRGLGLYIAKGLIEAQGGAIWVDSREGVGTTFSFTLPLASAAEVDRSRPTMETTPGTPGDPPVVPPR
jgi:signal transduction histidine kinase